MLQALTWYFALLLIGGAGLLPATLLFGRLRSRGVLYARPLALLLVAQLVWLASALASLPYGTGLVAAAVAVLYAWSAWLAWREPERLRMLRGARGVLLGGEALFLAVFVLVLFVRAQAPAAIATEKPMDLMLLNAVHHAERMPPPDSWLAGYDVSYYHLGHVMIDAGGRLAAVAPRFGFNLGLAAAAALAAAAIAGLASDAVALGPLRRRSTPWIAAGVSVVALIWVAPLEGLADLAAANGLGGEGVWGRLGMQNLPGAVGATHGVPDQFWWWWRATRIVPGTISEFPAFSYILGDPHAHVLALPLGIAALAVALDTFEGGMALSWRRWTARPQALLLAGALFAGLAMTNAWDVLAYGLIWLAAAAAVFRSVGWPLHGAVFGAARYLAAPALVGLVIAWPLLQTLDTSSIGATVVTDAASDPARLLLFWGAPLLPVLLAALFTRQRASRRAIVQGLALCAVPLLLWALWAGGGGERDALGARGSGWLTLGGLVIATGAAVAASASRYAEGRRAHAAWLALAATAGATLLATELFHVTDALRHARMNTVFKFWYVAWPLLAASGAIGLALAWDAAPAGPLAVLRGRLAPPRLALPRLVLPRLALPRLALPRLVLAALAAAAALLWLGSLLYAPAAAVSRAREGQARGLDALAHVERHDPGLGEALDWVRAELDPRRAVLLEAASRSYGPGNMISAASATPTLIGWPGHQTQWHSDGPLTERLNVVDAIYRNGAGPEALSLARRHGVTHIYLGREERSQFGADVAARFAAWPTVFEAPGTRIVAVPPFAAPGVSPAGGGE